MLAFIKNRPPLVIFGVCIIVTAVTLFSFAFYIKDNELIPDSDKNHEWESLIKHFNELQSCILPYTNITTNYKDVSTVQMLVRINASNLGHFDYIEGYLILEGWEAKCPKDYTKPNHLVISLDISKDNQHSPNLDVCATIKGPSEYLPKLSPNCEMDHAKTNKKQKSLLVTERQAFTPFCQKGVPIEIEFYPQKKETLANFLNNNQKTLIYVHLFWTSCFLISIILLIVVYAIFYSNNNFDNYFRKFSHLPLER